MTQPFRGRGFPFYPRRLLNRKCTMGAERITLNRMRVLAKQWSLSMQFCARSIKPLEGSRPRGGRGPYGD